MSPGPAPCFGVIGACLCSDVIAAVFAIVGSLAVLFASLQGCEVLRL